MDLRRVVPAAIRRRYAVKFGIALLVLGLSVGLIGFVATAGITHEVEERVQADQTSFAGQEAQGLQMWNEQNEQTIATFAHSDVVASDDPAAIEQRLLDWEEHLDADIFSISYADTDEGTIVASTDSDVRGASTDELESVPETAFDEATAEVPWVSEPYVLDGELGEDAAVITYALTVPGQDDRAIVYTAELEAYGGQFQDGEQVATVVVDGDNEVVLDNAGYGDDYAALGEPYGGDDTLLDTARTEGASTWEVSGNGASVLDTYEFDTDEYVVSSARVYGTDWVVLTHEPTDQAYGFVNTVNDWGYIATIVGVLMIGMVGAVIGRNTAVSIDRLTDKAGQMEDGDLDVDLETKRIDNIGRLYSGFDSMRVALREQIDEAETAREEAERERERIAEINDELERTADEYSDVMEAAADGDLTARIEADTDNEAMADIATDFNVMLEEIEQTVAELSQFASDVATASEQVTASSEEVRSASQQVTESIQEISDGAERQNQSLQSVNQEMSALSTTTEEIAASSNQVADIAEQTVSTGQEGQEAARGAMAAMDEIETEAGDAVDEIERLEEEVQQIDQLIATISEIARQTNMLALNANIEASRSASGEDEEGFSVVAKEVKALSEDVAEAADEAEDRLESIRARTEQSAAEVQGTSSDIVDAGERVQEAVEALEEIAELARETNVGVQEISAATEQQAASTQEVVAMVDDAATVSEETTSEAENVAAAAEEQTTALTEVTNSASNLSEQSGQLSAALDRFETDVEEAELDPDADLEAGQPELDLGDDVAVVGDDTDSGGDVDTDTDLDTGITFDEETAFEPVDESTTTDDLLDPVDTETERGGPAERSDLLADPVEESDLLADGTAQSGSGAEDTEQSDPLAPDADDAGTPAEPADDSALEDPDSSTGVDPLGPIGGAGEAEGEDVESATAIGSEADSEWRTESESSDTDGEDDERDVDGEDAAHTDDVFTFGDTADEE
ncbi:methyl-accepting chemotaxis protein [Natrialba sp. SSL1]|uniref:methyl-accepting chemotaxis protein n=1 Tax=Natrialba sp. SSL1 TaxID=1869245 RepID=UPI0008F8B6BB|nr:methyl-accepting chemotaxis protein [Natrialba sp. SSL1]OIB58281.1 chemotaxis protein [Natrialba sp. SSL1]